MPGDWKVFLPIKPITEFATTMIMLSRFTMSILVGIKCGLDSVYLWPWEMHLPAKVFIFGVVRNFSSDTIHDYVVNFQDKLFAGCDDGVRETFFTGRNIAPGQTDTVFFQTYSWELYEGKPFYSGIFYSTCKSSPGIV
jgi:hypothetical protein